MTTTVPRRRRGAVVLALAVAVLPGCGRKASIEEHRVTAVVREYNLALPRFYANRSLERLKGATTANEQERLENLIDALGKAGRALDTRQEALEVKGIKLFEPSELADVETEETWWYRHLDPVTRAVVQPPKRLRYALRYRLVQRDGRWLIDRIDMLRSEDIPVAD